MSEQERGDVALPVWRRSTRRNARIEAKRAGPGRALQALTFRTEAIEAAAGAELERRIVAGGVRRGLGLILAQGISELDPVDVRDRNMT